MPKRTGKITYAPRTLGFITTHAPNASNKYKTDIPKIKITIKFTLIHTDYHQAIYANIPISQLPPSRHYTPPPPILCLLADYYRLNLLIRASLSR
jgi:hypothetical protein